jgi:hypothetical protein
MVNTKHKALMFNVFSSMWNVVEGRSIKSKIKMKKCVVRAKATVR